MRIVEYEELIGNPDYILMDSPMAKALLDKRVVDEAIVKPPAAEFVWKIRGIEYGR
ncbi:MAG: GreA/GreB family elongation factor [Fulvivirga sp.]|uniref:GreA/GreB family elongation factor n=1 Tax=Fulvivirga sp. TaxID=1931237 RepID=UPI0032EE0592